MRLLNAKTYEFKFFYDTTRPIYAVLSHTWGADEATYEEINQGSRAAVLDLKSGSAKIRKCCSQAVKDGIEWVWIDTCCIDKSSSAELSEAINSMFTWYLQAEVCYAYLEDVPTPAPVLDEETFARSRWFTRGWTLQELIAPPSVEFYAHDWTLIGTKRMLSNLVERITGIDAAVLAHERSLSSYSVAARASQRETTRKEDVAYCLLGIFNVNMPLLYGEGSKAFVRLQGEILKQEEDYSILGWTCPNNRQEMHLDLSNIPFAYHPRQFKDGEDKLLNLDDERVTSFRWRDVKCVMPQTLSTLVPDILGILPASSGIDIFTPPLLTPRGLRLHLFVRPDGRFQDGFSSELVWIFALHTMAGDPEPGLVCIELSSYMGVTFKQSNTHLFRLPLHALPSFRPTELYIAFQEPSVSHLGTTLGARISEAPLRLCIPIGKYAEFDVSSLAVEPPGKFMEPGVKSLDESYLTINVRGSDEGRGRTGLIFIKMTSPATPTWLLIVYGIAVDNGLSRPICHLQTISDPPKGWRRKAGLRRHWEAMLEPGPAFTTVRRSVDLDSLSENSSLDLPWGGSILSTIKLGHHCSITLSVVPPTRLHTVGFDLGVSNGLLEKPAVSKPRVETTLKVTSHILVNMPCTTISPNCSPTALVLLGRSGVFGLPMLQRIPLHDILHIRAHHSSKLLSLLPQICDFIDARLAQSKQGSSSPPPPTNTSNSQQVLICATDTPNTASVVVVAYLMRRSKHSFNTVQKNMLTIHPTLALTHNSYKRQLQLWEETGYGRGAT